jgi:hypothetical protein
MNYIAFDTPQEAEDHRKDLQFHHDEQWIADQTKPRIIDCVVPTPDGRFATTLTDQDVEVVAAVSMRPVKVPVGGFAKIAGETKAVGWQDFRDGELVDTIDAPVDELVDAPVDDSGDELVDPGVMVEPMGKMK